MHETTLPPGRAGIAGRPNSGLRLSLAPLAGAFRIGTSGDSFHEGFADALSDMAALCTFRERFPAGGNLGRSHAGFGFGSGENEEPVCVCEDVSPRSRVSCGTRLFPRKPPDTWRKFSSSQSLHVRRAASGPTVCTILSKEPATQPRSSWT